eukprot:scaffold72703_cov17-Tisochrysis_lutea.AAC.1
MQQPLLVRSTEWTLTTTANPLSFKLTHDTTNQEVVWRSVAVGLPVLVALAGKGAVPTLHKNDECSSIWDKLLSGVFPLGFKEGLKGGGAGGATHKRFIQWRGKRVRQYPVGSTWKCVQVTWACRKGKAISLHLLAHTSSCTPVNRLSQSFPGKNNLEHSLSVTCLNMWTTTPSSCKCCNC